MTYNVFGGTLNLNQSTELMSKRDGSSSLCGKVQTLPD